MTEKKEQKEPAKLNLYQKLIEIRKQAVYLKKDANGYNFQYASGSSVIGALREKMDELGVLLKPEISNIRREGSIVWMDVLYTWIDADNPEDILPVPWFAIGQQKDPSQAFGSALTYAERYFLLKFFVIPTDKDDPDARMPSDEKPKSAPKPQLQPQPQSQPQSGGKKEPNPPTQDQRYTIGLYPIYIAIQQFPKASFSEQLKAAREIYEKAGLYKGKKPPLPNSDQLNFGRAGHIVSALKDVLRKDCHLDDADVDAWWEQIPENEWTKYRWWEVSNNAE